MGSSPVYVGIFEGHWDPAVAAVRDGQVLAYAEEERFVRLKHAPRIYPIRALKYCLNQANVNPDDIAAIATNWNLPAYTDGTMKAFFADMADRYPLNEKTRQWQQHMLGYFNRKQVQQRHEFQWHRAFRNVNLPPVYSIPHHYTHALQAYMQSPFKNALCITVDGSGDQHCTVLWNCEGGNIQPVKEICMPHSLGWFYAAFTEYLGFQAYDDEYKVMGLSAYGRPNKELRDKVSKVLSIHDDSIEYRLNPNYIHYGCHTWSNRFTDDLPELLGYPMRLRQEPITAWHQDLAYAVQQGVEEAVSRLVRWGVHTLNTHNVCVGGGVGLNCKMNSKLFSLDCVHDLFAHPLCSDGGAAAGAALGACWLATGARPHPLNTLALGYEEENCAIKHRLDVCKIPYEETDDIAEATAEQLARGRIVGWFQGRMEAGPRALGQRSILADPRSTAMRDRINEAVKYREYWRPFCPSMPAEDAPRYLRKYTNAPFMNIAFEASALLIREAPAIVHIDNTVRVQLVHREVNPLFHSLLKAVERKTGVSVLLNTSFNVKGEPVVCTFQDALRTFFSTGLDVMSAGDFIISKQGNQSDYEPFKSKNGGSLSAS